MSEPRPPAEPRPSADSRPSVTRRPLMDALSLGSANQTAWIFGAGAPRCKPYNVPTQFGLLRHFARQPVAGATPALRDAFTAARGRLPGWVNRVQPGREWTDPRVSLEEVFSHYELMLLPDAPHTPKERTEARQALDDLLLALRAATSVFGSQTAKKYRPFERGAGESAPYAELVERILTGAGTHLPRNYEAPKHTFVTMNYDINLDRCLLHLDARGLGTGIDYGFTLANARSRNAPPVPSDAEPAFRLYRVHGSMNWLRCDACGAVISTGHRHAQLSPGDRCGACDAEALSHLLVYPSYTRVYTDPVIGTVWRRTREALEAADRWVLIGYSLPPADVHFRSLLRGSLARRSAAGLETEILQVGRRPAPEEHAPKPDEFDLAVDTHEALFGDAVTFWDATANGFADFVRALRP